MSLSISNPNKNIYVYVCNISYCMSPEATEDMTPREAQAGTISVEDTNVYDGIKTQKTRWNRQKNHRMMSMLNPSVLRTT